MKISKLFITLILASVVALAVGACSWDFNNPYADEWDVQIIGDSVFDLSGDIHDILENLSGKSYKDRSVSGAKIAAIENQLYYAERRSSLKSLLADGGANDILQGSMDCDSDPLTQGCLDVLDYIGDTMWDMIVDMYYGPSNDHVWMGYYHVTGDDEEKNEAIDYAYANIYPSLFDLTNNEGFTYFEGYTPNTDDFYYGSELNEEFTIALADPRGSIVPSDLKSDGIHPTYSGSDKLARMLWDVMVEKNFYR